MNRIAHWRDAPEPDWSDAACQWWPLDAFFPETTAGRAVNYKTAKAVCRGCDIRDACLDWAILPGDPTNGEGVWGGCSPRDRELVRAERNRAAREAS